MKHSRQEIRKEVRQLGKNIADAKAADFGQLANNQFKNYSSIKDIIGLTDQSAESIYSQAYLLYNTGRYRDASEIFRLLIMLNSTEPKYLMGLAACFHMLKEYASAGTTYTLVSIIDPENPIPFFHNSDCYLQVGNKTSAAVMLEMAIKRAADKPEYATLKQRAEITLEALKKELLQTPAKPIK